MAPPVHTSLGMDSADNRRRSSLDDETPGSQGDVDPGSEGEFRGEPMKHAEPNANQTDANKAVVRRFIDEVFVQGRPESVDQLVAPDFVSETWGMTEDGRAKLRATTERMREALTDVRFDVEDVVAEGDRVAVRLTATGTPTGDFMGVAAAGKTYRIGEMHWFRVVDGRIVQHWHQHDRLGMMQQLGALPAKP
jgi:steroid delta-isomerase-like uncharacterized protein